MFQPHLKYTLTFFHICTSRSRYCITALFHSSEHFVPVLDKGLYQTESYSLHVMQLNTHLNHRRIFLFSTPCGVGSLLCMRNINCKPHWLAICWLSRILIFFSINSSEARKQYDEYCLSIMQTITYAHDRTHFQSTTYTNFWSIICPLEVDLREWNW